MTTADINTLIESTDNMYLKAWMALAFESGARFSEIKQLKYKDFKETNQGMIVNIPTSKSDVIRPAILLTSSCGYIRNLKTHVMTDENDVIFYLTQQGLAQHLNTLKIKSGMIKPLTPHKFRHAQATDMVARGYNEAIIKSKLGWKKNSNMASRYIHLNDNSVIDATQKIIGIDVKKIRKPIVELKEAEKLDIVDTSMLLTKLISDVGELKSQNTTLLSDNLNAEEGKKIYDDRIESMEKEMNSMQKFMAELIAIIPSNIVEQVSKKMIK